MKIIDKIVVSPTPPTQIQNAAWFDGKEIKIPSKGKYESTGGSGGGIEIVDSVDKLDPNAELGSMASVVTPGSIQETSFRNLYQPDMSMLDQTTGSLTQPELLSSVSSINFLTPTDYSGVETAIVLVPRTFSQTDTRMMQLMMAYSNGVLEGVVVVYMNVATEEQTNYLVGQVVDGVYTIDAAVVTAINDILASDDWCNFGYEVMAGVPMAEEQFATLDKFAMAVSDVPSITDIYVKGDKWVQLYKKNFERLASDLGRTNAAVESKANKIAIATYFSYSELQPNIYTTHSISHTSSVTIKLAAISDTTVYNEYILELKCTNTPSKVDFKNADGTAATIKWVNDTPPTFEAGFTYLISIANNFGVFAQYVNS